MIIKISFSKSTGLKVEDYEPAFALRKIALLYEKNLNEEVADLIGKLSTSTLQQIYTQFPLDLFIDGIPQTLTIVNTLYSRLQSCVRNHLLLLLFYIR